MLSSKEKVNIYFDNSATTPLAEDVIESMHESLRSNFANPSSIHSAGRKSKKLLTKARERLASEINAKLEEIKFLSGATEANNTVFKLCDYELIITSPSEHASVIEPAKATGKEIIWLELDQEGFICIQELDKHLKENASKKVLVSIMHANSEIGTIQDIEGIGKICKKHGAIFHSDCVQSLTKVPINVKKFNLDFISASAHKLHGPKGVGFLYMAKAAEKHLKDKALIIGGSQENNFRSGTENLPGILGFIKAIELSSDKKKVQQTKELRDKLLKALKKINGFRLNGPKNLNQRLCSNLNFALTNLKFTSEQLVLQLDLKGVFVSSGSACSSNKANTAIIESSYVLRACKIPEEIARKSIRLSLSWMNTEEEISQFLEILKQIN